MRRLARDVAYEIVVVDNAPEPATRELVTDFAADGTLDRLFLTPENILCAKGSTIAARLASPSATHLLLLKSAIRGHDGGWLRDMRAVHKPGATAIQIQNRFGSADGWCLLIDAGLYHAHQLDEPHERGLVTKLRQRFLAKGLPCRAPATAAGSSLISPTN